MKKAKEKNKCANQQTHQYKGRCVFVFFISSELWWVCARACTRVCMFLLDIFNHQHSKPCVRTTASCPENAATFLTNTGSSQILTHSYKAKKNQTSFHLNNKRLCPAFNKTSDSQINLN